MKRILSFFLAIVIVETTSAQNVGIGTTTPNTNAALEIKSNNKGILMPRTSASSKNGMTNVPKGMLVYDTTYSTFYYHDGNRWRHIAEKNMDSLLTDYSNTPAETVNMGSGSITGQLSGILYDNGGPAGNYASNSSNTYTVSRTGTSLTDSIAGFKVMIQEMNLESPYDSLEIYSDVRHKTVITGTTTGTYYFPAGGTLIFRFRSNAVNNLAGFKIVWSVLTVSNTVTEIPPLYGWYFNARKLAVRGGLRNGNDWSTDSLGKFSFAYGYNARATGTAAVAFMEGNAAGNYSLSIGEKTNALADYSVSIGVGGFFGANTAEGQASIAIGSGNHASGYQSRAIGVLNSPSGISSTAIGDFNSATGEGAMALGYANVASGRYALAMGYNAEASGNYSTALGNQTDAAGSYSTAMGVGTNAYGYATTAVGMYNNPLFLGGQTAVTPATPMFIVGNGESSAVMNAMVVLKNGNVGIGTDIPGANLHIKHAAGGGLILENANDNTKWRIYSASGDNNLTFYNNAGTEVADIDDVTGTFSALSDARYKKDIENVQPVLPLLMRLQPKYYHFNWQQRDEQKQVGFLAQDACKLFPELVSYSKEKDLYKMNYAGFSTVAIKAIQEQQTVIQNQQQQIDELKSRLEKLEAAVLKKGNGN